MAKSLGRRPAPDDRHIIAHPMRSVIPQTVERVRHVLSLPYQYRPRYNQGEEGACVGAGLSWAMSIKNRRFYDWWWLYRQAQAIDEWPGDDYDGTSTRAGCEILRTIGHKQVHDPRHDHAPDIDDGIESYVWATSVDQIRTSIALGQPVAMGIDWLESFDTPESVGRDWWIGRDDDGPDRVRGGHLICCYGADDDRQAVKLVNTWGLDYPLVWLPYRTLERLLAGYEWPGEAAILIDR